ncbi:cysteine peptidase family C39 domain-containing protein (plasmid) [Bradyrhizobium septentrionale]|nr:cysteine peptidase family C39 domain-containing protein [Bradyrhizobium septentrionale]UGY11910.1 cysteine peptidase family C39 domain-containing protein [Bradyrhizobium septentrionale]UGY30125.1 cysteine peptidase family C39 domain-containing protein [Bradyrhizobium septentrionale]
MKGGFDSLYKIPKPAIAHLVVKEVLHHFVVIQAIDRRSIIVMDPAYGEIRKLSVSAPFYAPMQLSAGMG